MNPALFKYSHFSFAPEWWEWMHKISDDAEFTRLFNAIGNYGLNEIDPEPETLSAESLWYFNTIIRPDLNHQHANWRKNQRNKERLKRKRERERKQPTPATDTDTTPKNNPDEPDRPNIKFYVFQILLGGSEECPR